MDKIPLYGKVENGIFASRQLLDRNFPRFNGRMVKVTLEEAKKKRTVQQNAYWFKMLDEYVVPAFRESGQPWSSFTIHEYIMQELGYQEVLITPQGKLFVSRKHSSGFNTKEWEVFMEEGREFLMRVHNIAVPLPNEIMD